MITRKSQPNVSSLQTHELCALGLNNRVSICAVVTAEGVSLARLWFWKGRAYDVFATYHAEAEKWLQKAVKREPELVEAWNALGNCECAACPQLNGLCFCNADSHMFVAVRSFGGTQVIGRRKSWAKRMTA
jgi:hypothetical protein